MKHRLIIFIATVSLVLGACQKELEVDKALPLRDKIDQLVKPLVLFGTPGAIIIGIIQDGEKTIYSYGDAGLGFGAPKSNTIFEIASNTKSFTAILLSEFINEGILSLNDSINKFLPSTVTPPTYNGKNITLKDLVTHTSGLPRELNNFNTDLDFFLSVASNDDMYEFLNDISKEAYPFDDFPNGNNLHSVGTDFRYSNVGIALLGHILELASGRTFEQLIDERICSKLNMVDTKVYNDLSNEQKERIPKGYNLNHDQQLLDHITGRQLGHGALLSTMDDLLNYMEANINTSPTSLSQSIQKTHELIYTREQICHGEFSDPFPYEDAEGIGMAWYLSDVDGDTIIEHGGGYNHYCNFKLNKNKKFGIVTLTNTLNVVEGEIFEIIYNWLNED